ncbi:MAG: hypothetical protein DLM65_10190 [Candidatus Aeolococcus gillhamiae]|uniref:Plasmid stabilization protein n=1 Tax=Candidatus Aeolococcus gillhamiae TaxID=3127015 RepID=A0A2W5Z320_9BACT|nr:MAG: hypothetical protein DLM65_10190 [Candidatus Dormibacter sp. RRmetagenome_bin12]
MSRASQPFATLAFTPTFLTDLTDRTFSVADRRAFIKALVLLETDDKHPSLRVHDLAGDFAGLWSASASASLRMTVLRTPPGGKIMLTCSRHHAK